MEPSFMHSPFETRNGYEALLQIPVDDQPYALAAVVTANAVGAAIAIVETEIKEHHKGTKEEGQSVPDDDCSVCMATPRAVRLPCGQCDDATSNLHITLTFATPLLMRLCVCCHSCLMCEACTAKLDPGQGCPICRSPFELCLVYGPALGRQPTFQSVTESFNCNAVSRYTLTGHECSNLGQAAYFGHETCIQRALDAGSPLDAKYHVIGNQLVSNQHGSTALHFAAAQGQLSCLNMLIEAGADHDVLGSLIYNDHFGATALGLAVRFERNECVRRLIKAGANCEATDSGSGATALWRAASEGYLLCVDALVTAGANTEARCSLDSSSSTTPLMCAACFGHDECVVRLVKAGANCEATDSGSGATALWLAARVGHLLCVDALVTAGANTEARGRLDWLSSADTEMRCNPAGKSPRNRRVSPGRIPQLKQFMRAVRKHPCPCFYVLYSAVGHLKLATYPNPGPVDMGVTPIWIAATYGHETCVAKLTEAGADVVSSPSSKAHDRLVVVASRHGSAAVGCLDRLSTRRKQAHPHRQMLVGTAALVVSLVLGFKLVRNSF